MSYTHHQSIYCEGTIRSSDNIVATAAGHKTALNALTVDATSRHSGVFSASAAGKQSTLTKLTVSGTTLLRGNIQATAALSGLKSIGSSGSATALVACALVGATSKILLTPIARTTNYKPVAAVIGVTAAASFRVILQRIQTAGTIIACKGTIAWMVIN